MRDEPGVACFSTPSGGGHAAHRPDDRPSRSDETPQGQGPALQPVSHRSHRTFYGPWVAGRQRRPTRNRHTPPGRPCAFTRLDAQAGSDSSRDRDRRTGAALPFRNRTHPRGDPVVPPTLASHAERSPGCLSKGGERGLARAGRRRELPRLSRQAAARWPPLHYRRPTTS